MAAHQSPARRKAWRIVGYYALFSALWILFSDLLLETLVRDPALSTRISVLKGWAFVAITSALLAFLLNRLLKELEEKQRQTQESAEQLQTFFDLAVDGILIGDEKGQFIGANSRACVITGYSREELLQRSMADLFTPEELALRPLRYDLLRAGEQVVNERWLTRRDGSQVAIEMHSKRLPNGTHQAFVRDVTERKRVESEILRLNEELEHRVAARTEELAGALKQMESFAFSISHDLRAPLRAISGFIALLQEDAAADLSDTSKQFLDRISRNAVKMDALITDLLTFSRSSRQQLEKQLLDPGWLVRQVLDDFAADLTQHQIEVTVHPLPPCEADAALLRQVLSNLVGNAIKFTRKTASPRIEIGARESDGTTVYYVRDNGIGFDMTHADKLFGVFQRLHSQEEFEGTGVGLAIVQNIITRHGGKVWAESRPEEGTVISFTL